MNEQNYGSETLQTGKFEGCYPANLSSQDLSECFRGYGTYYDRQMVQGEWNHRSQTRARKLRAARLARLVRV